MKLTVIICTYNPDPVIFGQCLEHIVVASEQFMPTEIIIVDNNSSLPLSRLDYIKGFLKKLKMARIVEEKRQGLTPARLKGIKEAIGDILLFIDDDNFVKPSFFSNGIRIANENMHIGAYSGQVKLLFEKEPQQWTKKYWGLLVYREFETDVWSNLPNLPVTMPCGAGLFVRKHVADFYHHLHFSGKRNIQLDRTGNSLYSAGDNDLAACACDVGLGVGIFNALAIDHYIPSTRTKKEYLLKLAEGIAASSVIFKSLRGEFPAKLSFKNKIANLLRLAIKRTTDRQFQKAVLAGERKAYSILRQTDNREF